MKKIDKSIRVSDDFNFDFHQQNYNKTTLYLYQSKENYNLPIINLCVEDNLLNLYVFDLENVPNISDDTNNYIYLDQNDVVDVDDTK